MTKTYGLRVYDFYKPGYLHAISSGLISIACFPTYDLYLLAWIALVPLLLALVGKTSKQSYALCFVAGFISSSGIYGWAWAVDGYNVLDHLLMGTYLANFWGVWGLGLTFILNRTGLPSVVIGPPLWVVLEFCRSHAGFLSLPFMLLGHSQYIVTSLIQIASFTGAYGISFLIVATNIALSESLLAVTRRRVAYDGEASNWCLAVIRATPVIFILVLVTAFGKYSLSQDSPSESIRIAVIQANISQETKWDGRARDLILSRHISLSREARVQLPDLIVWPETAVPGDLLHEKQLRETMVALARELKVPLLVGSSENAKFSKKTNYGSFYNSLFLISTDGVVEAQYKKMILVPFGEYVPLKNYIEWPEIIAPKMGDFVAGNERTVFSIGGMQIAPLICWETIFPDHVRAFVKAGAHLIINPTNEAMFGRSAISYQYLAMSVFRAVENRVGVVRAANTGVSSFVDPFGRIMRKLSDGDGRELFTSGSLVVTMPMLKNGSTFYTRRGDLFVFTQACLLLMFLVASTIPARTWIKIRPKEAYGSSSWLA